MMQTEIPRINNCRSCASKKIVPFLNLGEQPFANALLQTATDKEVRYPLELAFCSDCNLVQLQHTADPKELFSHYFWVTGTSSTAVAQADIFCQNAIARMHDNKDTNFVLEVASNDGTFLKPFIKKGFKVLGVDPAKNIAEQASANNVPTKQAFFGMDVAREVVESEKIRPNIVIARNVVAHVANLQNFINGISYLLDEKGIAIIECHYAKHILQGLQYDSIYHEHLCYFSVQSIRELLKKSGLIIFDICESPISGGALIVYARKPNTGISPNVKKYLTDEINMKLNQLVSWQDFANKTKQHKLQLVDLLRKKIAEGKKIVGYGASARSSTLLNFSDIDKEILPVIADQNPLKHGTFTAGSRIPIISVEEVMQTKPDIVLILAWNFRDEIINTLKNKFNFKGDIIIPLPDIPVLQTL